MQEGNLPARSIKQPAQNSTLPGWHAPEPNRARWTDGYALMEVPSMLPHALRVLLMVSPSFYPASLPENSRSGQPSWKPFPGSAAFLRQQAELDGATLEQVRAL